MTEQNKQSDTPAPEQQIRGDDPVGYVGKIAFELMRMGRGISCKMYMTPDKLGESIPLFADHHNELPFRCDACSTPGYGPNTKCSEFCDRAEEHLEGSDEIFWRGVCEHLGLNVEDGLAFTRCGERYPEWLSELSGSSTAEVAEDLFQRLRTDLHFYQNRIAEAHHALFHDDPTDIAERRDRHQEESNELSQSLGMTREEAHCLVDYTWDRPSGEPSEEIGASLLTLASLCVVAGYDMATCGDVELERLRRPEMIDRIRAKRATRHGRGPLPGTDAEGTNS